MRLSTGQSTSPAVPPGESEDQAREHRIELLIRRLPDKMARAMRRLRQPSARWARIPAAMLLIIGGVLSILPILGLWMLPLGLVLLAEDVKPLRSLTGRLLAWIEHRRPHWMGLPPQPTPDGQTAPHGQTTPHGGSAP